MENIKIIRKKAKELAQASFDNTMKRVDKGELSYKDSNFEFSKLFFGELKADIKKNNYNPILEAMCFSAMLEKFKEDDLSLGYPEDEEDEEEDEECEPHCH